VFMSQNNEFEIDHFGSIMVFLFERYSIVDLHDAGTPKLFIEVERRDSAIRSTLIFEYDAVQRQVMFMSRLGYDHESLYYLPTRGVVACEWVLSFARTIHFYTMDYLRKLHGIQGGQPASFGLLQLSNEGIQTIRRSQPWHPFLQELSGNEDVVFLRLEDFMGFTGGLHQFDIASIITQEEWQSHVDELVSIEFAPIGIRSNSNQANNN